MRHRKTITVHIRGRDEGKTFTIEEMSAVRAEEWFTRAMRMLASSGIDVPPYIFQHGPAGFAAIGLGTVLSGFAKSPWTEVKPLMDEMLTCIISFRGADAGSVEITTFSQIVMQIEETSTILHLREEILSLHLGFSIAARLSEFRTRAAQLLASLQNTSMSTNE